VKHQCGIPDTGAEYFFKMKRRGYRKGMKIIIYTAMVAVQVVLSLTSYIPQIVKLIKRKMSDDLSLTSWVMSLLDFTTYQILLIAGDGGLVLNLINALQIVQIVVVISLIGIYRKKE